MPQNLVQPFRFGAAGKAPFARGQAGQIQRRLAIEQVNGDADQALVGTLIRWRIGGSLAGSAAAASSAAGRARQRAGRVR